MKAKKSGILGQDGSRFFMNKYKKNNILFIEQLRIILI